MQITQTDPARLSALIEERHREDEPTAAQLQRQYEARRLRCRERDLGEQSRALWQHHAQLAETCGQLAVHHCRIADALKVGP